MNKHAIVACAAMALLALAALLAWQLGLEAPEVQANERGGEAVAVDPMAMDSRTTSEREPVAASNERSQATSKAGWWLVGSVTDAKDRPVAGARVLVSLRRGDVSQDVAEVRTDGTGRYEVDVAEARTLSPLQRRYASLVARATAKATCQAEQHGFESCQQKISRHGKVS